MGIVKSRNFGWKGFQDIRLDKIFPPIEIIDTYTAQLDTIDWMGQYQTERITLIKSKYLPHNDLSKYYKFEFTTHTIDDRHWYVTWHARIEE